MTSQVTSPGANVELVLAGFRAFNAGDTEECLAHIAGDLIMNLAELPEPQHGREAWRQGFEMMRRGVSHEFYRVADGVLSRGRSGSARTRLPCSASSANSPRRAVRSRSQDQSVSHLGCLPCP